jgi:hypothetical protein
MPETVGLSASIHGWHASYMPPEGANACAACHPNGPGGIARSQRDLHKELGVECTECHGTMQQSAAALLSGELDKPQARRMLKPLTAAGDSVVARTARVGQPDCLGCHADFQQPEAGVTAFNRWTAQVNDLYRSRTDMAGLRCPACHGPAHAVYPTSNPSARDRENMQPLQYGRSRAPIGSNGACAVCHRKAMQESIHHPNMDRPFRNTFLLE